MGFHGVEKYQTIPEVRYGIIPGRSISQSVYIPGRKEYRSIQPVSHVLKVYKSYYDTFEQDIKKNGFRNPPLCWSFNGDTHVIYGTVRAWIARKLDINMPVFIVDWDEYWIDLELILNKEQALKKFIDPPIELVFEKDFFSYYNKRNDYDPYEIKRKIQKSKQGQTQ